MLREIRRPAGASEPFGNERSATRRRESITSAGAGAGVGGAHSSEEARSCEWSEGAPGAFMLTESDKHADCDRRESRLCSKDSTC